MATIGDATTLPWVDEIAGSFPQHDFVAYHRRELPGLIERNGHLVDGDLSGAAPLAFRLADGLTFTYVATEESMRVVDGDCAAETLVEITAQGFSDFVNELLTASGAINTGRARLVRGSIAGFKRWEPSLQALWSGRKIFGPAVAAAALVDRDGLPLDLKRSFTVDDSEEDLRDYFMTAGYLHLRNVFTPDEVALLGAEVERCRDNTTPGDGFSWWSVDSTGREVVTRINYLDRFSDVLAAFSHDVRLARFARLAGADLRVCDDRLDGPMVFIKNPNVVKGNGDLEWHVDDGVGGHPVMCPLIQAGVQLDRANAENGQLLVLAGSHRYPKHWLTRGQEGDLPVVALDTEPGDLTLHYGDTMHTTPPPLSDDAGRRVLYYKFAEPKTFEWIPAGCHYNDVLFRPDPNGRIAARATSWD
ncbi:MAG TPA: phytanoyl-CoA dioxygenase family protein [Acidimicrobiales bacterium]|nr:phytanoyl-CoA dioxygenase family protein [Acidimicrobiales bacterium]